MPEVTIKVRDNGPYLVSGTVTITDALGQPFVVEGDNMVLCRCGGSQTKPFCDGSHKTNGFCSATRVAGMAEEKQ